MLHHYHPPPSHPLLLQVHLNLPPPHLQSLHLPALRLHLLLQEQVEEGYYSLHQGLEHALYVNTRNEDKMQHVQLRLGDAMWEEKRTISKLHLDDDHDDNGDGSNVSSSSLSYPIYVSIQLYIYTLPSFPRSLTSGLWDGCRSG